jgi:hypothetical protein
MRTTCQYGNSDAEWKQKRTGSFEPWVELVQEAIKSGQNDVQQSRDLVSQRTSAHGRCPRKQKIPHENEERVTSTAQVDRACHDLFALPGGLGHAGEQWIGWIRPGQQIERPGIDQACPTYGHASRHPSIQLRNRAPRVVDSARW